MEGDFLTTKAIEPMTLTPMEVDMFSDQQESSSQVSVFQRLGESSSVARTSVFQRLEEPSEDSHPSVFQRLQDLRTPKMKKLLKKKSTSK